MSILHPKWSLSTHSCCKFLWFRTCSTHPGLDIGSRHVPLPRLKQSLRITQERRQSCHPWADPTRFTQLLTALLRGKERAMRSQDHSSLGSIAVHTGGAGTASHVTSKRRYRNSEKSGFHCPCITEEKTLNRCPVLGMGGGGWPDPRL